MTAMLPFVTCTVLVCHPLFRSWTGRFDTIFVEVSMK